MCSWRRPVTVSRYQTQEVPNNAKRYFLNPIQWDAAKLYYRCFVNNSEQAYSNLQVRGPSWKIKGMCGGCQPIRYVTLFLISHFRPGNPAATPFTAGVKTNAIKF